MNYGAIPLIIPVLAIAYLLSIYGLLTLVAHRSNRQRKSES
ncbi:hypothetical protein ACFVKH_18325 [Almyronema epifaneia S1]|uniref:Uncharacterized protein n=1 Tax=Almyronema epifaneia S1 TaxID=2991925 RepID=A0ABW6IJ58_9CYAN